MRVRRRRRPPLQHTSRSGLKLAAENSESERGRHFRSGKNKSRLILLALALGLLLGAAALADSSAPIERRPESPARSRQDNGGARPTRGSPAWRAPPTSRRQAPGQQTATEALIGQATGRSPRGAPLEPQVNLWAGQPGELVCNASGRQPLPTRLANGSLGWLAADEESRRAVDDLEAPVGPVSLVFWFKDDEPAPIYTLDARAGSSQAGSGSSAHPEGGGGGQVLAGARHYARQAARLDASRFPLVALQFERLTVAHSGRYRCRVDYRRARTVSQRLRLLVQEPVSELELRGPPTLLEGAQASFTCRALNGSPQASLSWLLRWPNDESRPAEELEPSAPEGSRPEAGSGSTSVRLQVSRRLAGAQLGCRASQQLVAAANHSLLPSAKSIPGGAAANSPRPPEAAMIDANEHVLFSWLELAPNLAPQAAELEVRHLGARQTSAGSWALALEAGARLRLLCRGLGALPGVHISWHWGGGAPLVPLPGGSFQQLELNASASLIELQVPAGEPSGKLQVACSARNPRLPEVTRWAHLELSILDKPTVQVSAGSGPRKLICKVRSNPSIHQLVWLADGRPVARLEARQATGGCPPAELLSGWTSCQQLETEPQVAEYKCLAINILGETRSSSHGRLGPTAPAANASPKAPAEAETSTTCQAADWAPAGSCPLRGPRLGRFAWALVGESELARLVASAGLSRASILDSALVHVETESNQLPAEPLGARPELTGGGGGKGALLLCWAADSERGWLDELGPCVLETAPNHCNLVAERAHQELALRLDCDRFGVVRADLVQGGRPVRQILMTPGRPVQLNGLVRVSRQKTATQELQELPEATTTATGFSEADQAALLEDLQITLRPMGRGAVPRTISGAQLQVQRAVGKHQQHQPLNLNLSLNATGGGESWLASSSLGAGRDFLRPASKVELIVRVSAIAGTGLLSALTITMLLLVLRSRQSSARNNVIRVRKNPEPAALHHHHRHHQEPEPEAPTLELAQWRNAQLGSPQLQSLASFVEPLPAAPPETFYVISGDEAASLSCSASNLSPATSCKLICMNQAHLFQEEGEQLLLSRHPQVCHEQVSAMGQLLQQPAPTVHCRAGELFRLHREEREEGAGCRW